MVVIEGEWVRIDGIHRALPALAPLVQAAHGRDERRAVVTARHRIATPCSRCNSGVPHLPKPLAHACIGAMFINCPFCKDLVANNTADRKSTRLDSRH